MATATVAVATDYDRLAREARDGGFTYSLVTGTEPRTGYAFSPYPSRSLVTPTASLSADDVRAYADKHADLLARPDHYLGAWRQRTADVDQVWLDVSIVADDRATAEVIGSAFDQLAAWDIAAGEEIPL